MVVSILLLRQIENIEHAITLENCILANGLGITLLALNVYTFTVVKSCHSKPNAKKTALSHKRTVFSN
ncbi:MAG: hypothetical protein QGG64_06880 [Candidatus Latescibacteria bacterium]|nr:hypothetical protein [Candidatus Latescibacterota bacterium]